MRKGVASRASSIRQRFYIKLEKLKSIKTIINEIGGARIEFHFPSSSTHPPFCEWREIVFDVTLIRRFVISVYVEIVQNRQFWRRLFDAIGVNWKESVSEMATKRKSMNALSTSATAVAFESKFINWISIHDSTKIFTFNDFAERIIRFRIWRDVCGEWQHKIVSITCTWSENWQRKKDRTKVLHIHTYTFRMGLPSEWYAVGGGGTRNIWDTMMTMTMALFERYAMKLKRIRFTQTIN